MAVYIPNYTKADMDELFKWARHGRNNAMIGVNTEIIEIPPHGRLIDGDKQDTQIEALIERHLHGYTKSTWDFVCELRDILKRNHTIIPAEEVKNEDLPIQKRR